MKESKAQKETIERVMHEAKHGELRTARGRKKVTNRKQAIAIALREAGASQYESPKENRRALARTKAKERRGETYKDEAEGRGTKARGRKAGSGKGSRARSAAPAKSTRRKASSSRRAPAKRRARR